MNIRKFSINKACILLGILLLLASWCGFCRYLSADREYNRCRVCVLVQCLCVALRHLLCDPDPSETGHVLVLSCGQMDDSSRGYYAAEADD